MKATLAQIAQIPLFSALETESLKHLQDFSSFQLYQRKEIILHEGDALLEELHILFSGLLSVQKKYYEG